VGGAAAVGGAGGWRSRLRRARRALPEARRRSHPERGAAGGVPGRGRALADPARAPRARRPRRGARHGQDGHALIAIVDAEGDAARLVGLLRARGVRCAHLASDGAVEARLAAGLEAADYVERWVGRVEGAVEAILAPTEGGAHFGARLAAGLGLAGPGSPWLDAAALPPALDAAGVPALAQVAVESAAQVVAWTRALGIDRVLVRPAAGPGPAIECRTATGLAAAVAGGGARVAQELPVGPIYVLAAVGAAIVAVWREEEDGTRGTRRVLVGPGSAIAAAVAAHAGRALEALGAGAWPSVSRVVVAERGPRLVAVAPHLDPWCPAAALRACGLPDPVELLTDAALGRRVAEAAWPTRSARLVSLRVAGRGHVIDARGLDAIAGLPSCASVVTPHRIGAWIDSARVGAIAAAVFVDDDPEAPARDEIAARAIEDALPVLALADGPPPVAELPLAGSVAAAADPPDASVAEFAARPALMQGARYAQLIRSFGWEVLGEPGAQLFVDRPNGGRFAKMERPRRIDLDALRALRVAHVVVEPAPVAEVVANGATLRLEFDPTAPGSYVERLGALGLRPLARFFSASRVMFLDLRGGEASAFAPLRRDRMREARQSERRGVRYELVRFCDADRALLDEASALQLEWRVERGHGFDHVFMAHVRRAYADRGWLLCARAGGRLLGVAYSMENEGVLVYHAVFTSADARRLHVGAGLVMANLRLGLARGCDFVELGCVRDRRFPGHEDWDGLTSFKESFGPRHLDNPPSFLLAR
jgi:hypothetical protein